MVKKIRRILTALKRYYAAPLETNFRQFRNGLIYFSVGMLIIYQSHANLEDSLQQEIIFALGLLLIAIGFFIAMMAQIHMIISRIIAFFSKK